MAVLKVGGSIYVCGMGSSWKQRCLRNDLRCLRLNVMVVSETRIADTRGLVPIFDNFETFSHLLIGREGGWVDGSSKIHCD